MDFIVFKFSSILVKSDLGVVGLKVEVSIKEEEVFLTLKLLSPERSEK